MIIRTITCHDVYNVGASLQAYALSEYLSRQGHDVKIIDYKPDYLSKKYNFKAVDNSRFEHPFFIRWLYLILKFPKRLYEYPGKKNFDRFREQYLCLTKRYHSLEELEKDPPKADLYIAGSDQIWNTLFQNGKDGAFYLTFAPEGTTRASYAASFATEAIVPEWEVQVGKWLREMDFISVREKSSLKLLERLEVKGQAVLDPVFLLPASHWKQMVLHTEELNNIFVYDFDKNEFVKKISLKVKEQIGANITSFFKTDYADSYMKNVGPLEFLTMIYQSKVVISNSFHATVFSLIFHKEFYVIKRNEDINIRMMDLLRLVGLEDRLIANDKDLETILPVNWEKVDAIIQAEREYSKQYLAELIKNENS